MCINNIMMCCRKNPIMHVLLYDVSCRVMLQKKQVHINNNEAITNKIVLHVSHSSAEINKIQSVIVVNYVVSR